LRRLVTSPRVVTCDPARATALDPLGAIDDGAVLIDEGAIVAVGHRAELAARAADAEVVAFDGVVTPGLVDAHTHAPYVGSRDAEYALRMQGKGYEEIAAAGGGIVASMRAVRAASVDELTRALVARLGRMRALGVTTVECKSGYGLDLENEMKQLEAVRRAAAVSDVRLVPTYLALHALPPEANGDRRAFSERVARAWLPKIAGEELASFVDAYIDRAAFTVDEARGLLEKGRELGLGLRVHAGQFDDVGAAMLAASVGAASADHLEHVGDASIEAMARAGVRAVLLPIASFTLGQSPPPVAALRAAGVNLVVASDANPGTAPTDSLPLALALAVRTYGLTVAEAILGATREAAASLGLADVCGALRSGLAADVVAWDLPHEAGIVQPWGGPRVAAVFSASGTRVR
jgi:imidazolonepropionase